MAATLTLHPAQILLGAVAAASIVMLLLEVGARMLGDPPPGMRIGWLERIIPAIFVGFLAIGPLYLARLVSGGCK